MEHTRLYIDNLKANIFILKAKKFHGDFKINEYFYSARMHLTDQK